MPGMTVRLLLPSLAAIPFLGLLTVAGAEEFSPAEAEARAVRYHPGLAAARFRIEEARGRMRQAGLRPNPELQFEAGLNAEFREGSLMAGFVQRFPATAKLRLEKEVSQALVEAAVAEVKSAEREVVLEVRQLVVKVLALDAQQALRARQMANAGELADFATKRAEAGEGSALEAAQFELEAQQIGVESLQLRAEKAGVLGALRPMLGLAGEAPLSLKGTLAAPRNPGAGPAPESRPEYEAAGHYEQAALRGIALEKARRREDVSAGIFGGAERTEDAPDGLGNDGLIGIRVSIPLPLWNRNEGKIQEATATSARLAAEKEALVFRLRGEARAARDSIEALAGLLSAIDETLLPQTTELEEKLQAFYSSGQAPLTDVLRARDKRLELERTRLDALRDYHLARASLGLGLP